MSVTIILQGITCAEIDLVNTLDNYTKLGTVILSIYLSIESPSLISLIRLKFPRVIIFNNDLESLEKECEEKFGKTDKRYKHTFFQHKCVSKPLDFVTDKYVIKSRVDHYYEDLDKFIKKLYTDKLVTSSIHVCGTNQIYGKFFLSDCLFGGLTSEIKNLYNLFFLSKKIIDHPEVALWKPYLSEKISINCSNEEYAEEMSKIVTVYSLCGTSYKIKLSAISRKLPFTGGRITFKPRYTNIHTNLEVTSKTDYEYFLNGIDWNWDSISPKYAIRYPG